MQSVRIKIGSFVLTLYQILLFVSVLVLVWLVMFTSYYAEASAVLYLLLIGVMFRKYGLSYLSVIFGLFVYVPLLLSVLIMVPLLAEGGGLIEFAEDYIDTYAADMVHVSVAFIMMIFLMSMSVKRREKVPDEEIWDAMKTIPLNATGILVFGLIAMASVIIAFPRLSAVTGSFDPDERYVRLFAGNGWMVLSAAAYFFMLVGDFKVMKGFRILVIVFVPMWSILNYERADIMGILLLGFLYFIHRYLFNKATSWWVKALFIFGSIGLFLFVSITVLIRTGGSASETQGVAALLNLTALDVLFVYVSAFEVISSLDGLAGGFTYIRYLRGLFPSIIVDPQDDVYGYTSYLSNIVPNTGGGYFVTEPVLNFGYILGPLLAAAIYFLIYLVPFKFKMPALARSLWYYIAIITLFRTVWYGLIYIEKIYVNFLPLLLVIYILLQWSGVEKRDELGSGLPLNRS